MIDAQRFPCCPCCNEAHGYHLSPCTDCGQHFTVQRPQPEPAPQPDPTPIPEPVQGALW